MKKMTGKVFLLPVIILVLYVLRQPTTTFMRSAVPSALCFTTMLTPFCGFAILTPPRV